MSQFATPASSTGIEWASLKGSLLIVEPVEVVKEIPTNFGTTDAVRATVTVVDGPTPGQKYADTLVFPKVLQAQISSRIGEKVLGRLGQGQAKPGQSAPWMLTEASPEDTEKAVAFLATRLSAADIV